MNQSLRKLRISLIALSVAGLCAIGAVGCKKAQPLAITESGELTDGDEKRSEDDTPQDKYTFTAGVGDVVTVNMTAENNGFDTYLLVGNPDGSEVGQNDDCVTGNPDSGSCMTFTVRQKGVHTVYANAVNPTDRGRYTLRITSTLAP